MVLASVIQTVYPDVWYDTNLNAIVGTASWVIAGLATGYFVLKWLKNSEKFYAALARQGWRGVDATAIDRHGRRHRLGPAWASRVPGSSPGPRNGAIRRLGRGICQRPGPRPSDLLVLRDPEPAAERFRDPVHGHARRRSGRLLEHDCYEHRRIPRDHVVVPVRRGSCGARGLALDHPTQPRLLHDRSLRRQRNRPSMDRLVVVRAHSEDPV